MLNTVLFGLGKIGQIHLQNLSKHADINLIGIVDPLALKIDELCQQYGVLNLSQQKAFEQPLDAVIIASTTDTHISIINEALSKDVHVFCEKPIDKNLPKVHHLQKYYQHNKKHLVFAVDFNRRHDPDFQYLKQQINTIKPIENITIISRDPHLPPLDYIKVSGGIFFDMTIHDFDMARWLCEDKIVEVFAQGSCHVEPKMEEMGDYDGAVVLLKTASKVTIQIINSRRAVYGYDQRIEVFGANGKVNASNHTNHQVQTATQKCVKVPLIQHFFLQRYAKAYVAALEDFIHAIQRKTSTLATIDDGIKAQRLAETAQLSVAKNRPISCDI